MKAIGPERQVILLCDSWYPKAEVAALVEQFENLEMVCNVRVDTALYGLPSAKTWKRGRPRKRGNRISLDEVLLNEPKNGDWMIGMMPVVTNLWKDKVVYALVTAPKNGKGSRRLFLCTADPRSISFDWENRADKAILFRVSVCQCPGNPLRNQPANSVGNNFMQFRKLSRNY